LSGASATQVSVGSNQDRRLQVVYIGTNKAIYNNVQTAPNSATWVGESLVSGGIGGTVEPDPTQQIVIGPNQTGALELFYVAASTAIHHNVQTAPNGPWAGEARVESQDYAKEVAIANNADGSLAVAYISQVVSGSAGGNL
jgi:hypothetical protein